MKFYEVSITKTWKQAGRSTEGYQTYDREQKRFTTIEEAKTYLVETYGKCRKLCMGFLESSTIINSLGRNRKNNMKFINIIKIIILIITFPIWFPMVIILISIFFLVGADKNGVTYWKK